MSCLFTLARSRCGVAVAGILTLGSACGVFPPQGRALDRYRAPSVVVAYPDRGAALPADRAFIALRFAPGEPDDPIDVESFRATLDGADRSALFQVTDTQAWARLGDGAAPAVTASGLTPGPHTVGARICSVRGACGAVTFVLSVQPWERTIDGDARVMPAVSHARVHSQH